MRLDKFFTHAGLLSRKECASACKNGRITVNGICVKDCSAHINEKTDSIALDGQDVSYSEYVYIMLNKPSGYVSSTDEPGEHTVLELLSETDVKIGVFPCGRLDKDTTGLLIMTSDGPACHRALAPKSHVEKKYEFECADVLCSSDVEKMTRGITLADGYTTLPCEISLTGSKSGIITLREGKYHQIKRMLGAVGNKITRLKRISFGTIALDGELSEGEWRYLTDSERESFTGHNTDKE